MILYFAYGSNMNPWQWVSRCPHSNPKGIIATLENYKLVAHYYASVEPFEGSKVCGVLYEMDEKDLPILNKKEGYQEGRKENIYDKHLLEVVTQNGEKKQALVYIMTQYGMNKIEEKINAIRYNQPYPVGYQKKCADGAAFYQIHPNPFERA